MTDHIDREVDDKEKFAALAFKIMTDPFVGKLTYFRVYSGTLKSGSYVYNPVSDKKERISRILRMHANTREDVDEAYAGDIVAAVGLKHTRTGDTLCDEDDPIILEKMTFPDPVIHVAIEPKTKADQEKMGEALPKLSEEDPTLRVSTNEETGQTIISGMGELHLEIIIDRMKREFKVEANIGKPQVAYKETIRKKVQAEGKFVRQSGGRGQYGHVWIEVEPNEKGKGFEFENAIVGGVDPERVHQAGGAGYRRSDEERRARRLSGGGRQGEVVRRVVPRGRFVGNGLQDCRFDGVQGGGAQGGPGHPGTDHGGRGGDARGVHGRRHRAT